MASINKGLNIPLLSGFWELFQESQTPTNLVFVNILYYWHGVQLGQHLAYLVPHYTTIGCTPLVCVPNTWTQNFVLHEHCPYALMFPELSK